MGGWKEEGKKEAVGGHREGGGERQAKMKQGVQAILFPFYLKKYTLQTISSMDHTWQGISWGFWCVCVFCFTCNLAHCQNSLNVEG